MRQPDLRNMLLIGVMVVSRTFYFRLLQLTEVFIFAHCCLCSHIGALLLYTNYPDIRVLDVMHYFPEIKTVLVNTDDTCIC